MRLGCEQFSARWPCCSAAVERRLQHSRQCNAVHCRYQWNCNFIQSVYYTLIYQKNCTLFYFIKNNTLKKLYCLKVLQILRHVSVSSWPSSGRYLFSLRQLLKINFLGLWKHVCCTCCALCWFCVPSVAWLLQYNNNNNQATDCTQNQHINTTSTTGNASTNLKSLSLVTDVKKINISLRMVKKWPKHVGEFLGPLNNTTILMCCFNKVI